MWLRQVALGAASGAALLAMVAALGVAPPGGRTPWRCFAAAMGAALVGQALLLLEPAGRVVAGWSVSIAYVTFALIFPLFAAGAALGLRLEHSRERAAEIGFDAAIVLLLSAALVDRILLDSLVENVALSGWTLLVLVTIPAVASSAILLTIVLLLTREGALPRRAVPLIVGAAIIYAGAVVPPAIGIPVAAQVVDGLWILGCVLLALAGLSGVRYPLDAVADGMSTMAGIQMRRTIVPAGVVVLAAGGMSAALDPQRDAATFVGLALLGMLLVLRTGQALQAAERGAEERQQLEHTRALVEVSRALAGATEVSGALDLVTSWARRLLEAPAAAIELVVDEHHLEIMAASGLPAEAIGMRYSLEDSFTGAVARIGQARVTDEAATDPDISPESRTLLGRSAVAAVPLQYGDRTLGVLSCIRQRTFTVRDLELLRALADQAAIAIETAQLFEQVHSLSLTDPLTGLANRRQLERDLAREFAAAQRGRRVVCVLFDLDEFKPYNDCYGHLAGDDALRAFADVLAMTTRVMNLAARYGGDEFVAILSDTDLAGAEAFVERVRTRFPVAVELLGHGPLGMSAGIAEYTPEMESPQDLLEAADRALYASKAQRLIALSSEI